MVKGTRKEFACKKIIGATDTMPIVEFPYNRQGEKNARAAARMHGGKYISDKKGKGKGKGIGVMIAVGPVKKKSPARRTRKKA